MSATIGRFAKGSALWATGLLALCLVSAAPLPSVDESIRRGNEAFAGGEYEKAFDLFREAEGKTLDPGLIAFNEGAALFRLGRFAEAAAHYQRCLEDDAAPAERRRRAFYDLGAALLRQSKGTSAALLRRAIDGFRSCLALDPAEGNLKEDARFNLELAQRLWLTALARKDTEENGGPEANPKEGKKDAKGPDELGKKTDKGAKGDTAKKSKGDGADTSTEDGSDKEPASGSRLALPDAEALRNLPPAEVQRLLVEQVERISRERKIERDAAARSAGTAPNW